MSKRPDHVKCIQHTHADLKDRAWCGRSCPLEWTFQGLDHAAYAALAGDRLQPCPECVRAAMACLLPERGPS